jgi:hypothetical protein
MINVNKSAGPDGLHPTVIKNVAQYISPMLAHIFINSLQKYHQFINLKIKWNLQITALFLYCLLYQEY